MAEQKSNSGALAIIVGAVLVLWGLWLIGTAATTQDANVLSAIFGLAIAVGGGLIINSGAKARKSQNRE